MEPKTINPQPVEPEPQPIQLRPEKPYKRFAWIVWTGWLIFAALVIVSLSRSLQPRMDGMPITGGTMQMNNGNSSTTTNSDNSMPGMNMGK